jgi:hypothetical protein
VSLLKRLGAAPQKMLSARKSLNKVVLLRCSIKQNKNELFQKSTVARYLSSKIDSFLSGSNSVYVEQMYSAWSQDPKRFVFRKNIASLLKQ